MTKFKHESVREENGFTLVELAIVMVIIGIILGGILKGQEVITNARVSSTIALSKAIDTATSTFRDIYDTLPGDMAAPGTRLPNCTAVGGCATGGDANGQLSATPGTNTGENLTFFVHLAAADLITGVSSSGTATNWGVVFPAAPIDGGFVPGFSTGAAGQLTANSLGGGGRAGHYIMLQAAPGAAGGVVITPSQAFRMDNKLDDSVPGTGAVIGVGTATCGTATVYAESQTGENCAVAIRIQG
ncbi:MAG: prepilin-type N-terminal cleavage/methylation domain-containing protein [Alphaproteobacteria bacterium]|nr:prepilin-type N-terminal cleavage/methylation domain-containing protein [Alphaproteobacteria bacterium]